MQSSMPDTGKEYVQRICRLYGDAYDDRAEDPEDRVPGGNARHKSLEAFRRELKTVHGISMSTAKIRKILITGGLWTTERSREAAALYERLGSVAAVSRALGVSEELVIMYMPYGKTVYGLETKSSGAGRVQRWREKQRKKDQSGGSPD